MKRGHIVVGSAALALAFSAFASSSADAGCFGCAVGVGVLGGIAAGAIVGSAIANSPPPPPAYYPPPPPPAAYYPPPPAYAPAYAELAPGCYWGKRKVWVDGAGYRWRTVQVCP